MLSNLKDRNLKPLAWVDIDLNLPEVIEYFGEDGARQWKLATALQCEKVDHAKTPDHY